jgi:deoxyribonuclease V
LRLSKRIIFQDKLPGPIRYVAGVDVAYVRDISIGAAAVLSYDALRVVETETAKRKTRFPYIPTLLSFREIPPVLAAFRRLRTQPDVVMVDGQGYAHPYRCGSACHLGLTLGIPTIGVAKSRLVGDIELSTKEEGTALLKYEGETVGAVVTTVDGRSPVFVSVGHMISLESAVSVVRHCVLQNRIPEPIRKAHEAANSEKRKIQILSATNIQKTK